MIFLDLGDLEPPRLVEFREVTERAARHFELDHPTTADWFKALCVVAWREQNRRGDEKSTHSFPLAVPWELPPDMPPREVDDTLEYVIAATAALQDSCHREGLRGVAYHLRETLVLLAELRDQRRAESRLTRRMLAAAYLRRPGPRPGDDEEAA